MSDWDTQRDIEVEGQRAAVFHAKKKETPFSRSAIEALYQGDIRRASETFNALVEQAEKDRARRMAFADDDSES